MDDLIFIPGNIPSLKNSKVLGRYPSKTVIRWLRLFGIQSYNSKTKTVKEFKRIPKEYSFLEICKPIKSKTNYPLLVEFHFIRGTKHKWDFHNACQIVFDLMVAYDIIPDDSVDYVLPFPLKIKDKFWDFSKENPGVLIKVKQMYKLKNKSYGKNN